MSMNVKFSEGGAFSVDFGPGVPVHDYDGPYEVMPTEEVQSIPSAHKMLDADVIVDPIPSDYVGSGIPHKTGADLTVSGDTVSVPAGYYEESASKAVAHGSAKSAEGTVTVNPSVSVDSNGKITATVSKPLTLTPTVVPGYVASGTPGTLVASGSATEQLTTKAGETVTPTESVQDVAAAGVFTTGDIKVDAIPSTYVGSDIDRLDSSDLTVSGPTVTAPAGFYESGATKTIASGTEGTPTATKGTVNNHAVSVTPAVTNAAGYIAGGTHTGTAVSIAASDLVSGTKTFSAAGTEDVTNYQYATVPAGTEGTPTASKSTVSGHAVTVTPSVTNSAGYITGGTKTGTGVSVSASELVSGTYNVTSSGTKDVTNYASASIPAGTAGTPMATKGTVSSNSVTVTPSVTNSAGYISGGTKTGTGVSVSASELVSGTKSITDNGTGIDVTNYAAVDVAVPSGTPTLQTKTKSYTPTEAAQSETVTYDAGYDGLDEVNISVGAISSTYVGSGITQRDSTDLSASGATVTAPAGYYASNATKSVSSGTEGTPTATKGTVSSNRVTVTPSVTNGAGYISGGTHTGTGVTVQASELVSGTKTITGSGTTDVANYANASVAAGSATVPSTASGTGATASQSGTTLTLTKTISITPTVSAGYVSSGTAGNIALTISATDANFDAANIKSGVSIFGKTGTYTGGGGGSSNIAQGTFTTGSTRGSNSSVSVSYSGTGYPIACFVYVDGGPYNNGTQGNTTWYNSVNRYDCGYYSMVKSSTTEAPTYTTSGTENYGTCAVIYKNSTTQATTYTQASSRTINTFTSSTSNPNNSNGCIRFKGNGKTLAYYIGNLTSSTVGLAPSTKYAYIVIYSS